MPRRTCPVALLALCLALPVTAQPGDGLSRTSPIGMNLAGVVDWSTEWVFVDVFRHAREWIPQLTQGGPWNTGAPLARTPEGWPLPAAGQAAATLLCRDLDGHYPAGTYLAEWSGTGQVSFGFDAQVSSQGPNQALLDVTPGNGGIFVRITASDPADPVRDLRVWMPGFHQATDPFHPLFLARLEPFSVLRFMDFQRTNGSPLQSWSERVTPATFSQATDRGVALEFMIALCNRLRADAWFCMPHQADDAFVTAFATLVRDTLDPELQVFVEYSNETWNGIFPQAGYCGTQGLALGLSTNPFQAQLRYHAHRAVQIFGLWNGIFGAAAPDRLIRVLSSQGANPWTAEQVLDWQSAYQHADALAIAPYFGGGVGYSPVADGFVANPSVPAVLAWVQNDLDQVEASIASNAALAQARGLELIAYEGGQHMVGVGPWQADPTLTSLLIATNRAPGMHALYRDYLARWFDNGGGRFAAFSSCGLPSQYGSWGALEHQDQDLATAHKYRAIRDEVLDGAAAVRVGVAAFGLHAGISGPVSITATAGATQLLLAGAPAGVPVWLSAGVPVGVSPLGPVPLALDPWGLDGCVLVQTTERLEQVGTSDASGNYSMPLTLPNEPALIGLEFAFQWLVPAPGTTPAGWLLSDGMILRPQP